MGCIKQCLSRMNRKQLEPTDVMITNLNRCLSTIDLISMAIGLIVGSGIYVVIANAAKNLTGPAIVLAFLISGVAATLSAFCYAELGTRFPKAGSVYSYAYLSLGEFWAFLVGWTVVLVGSLEVASVARACSAYVDSLAGGIVKNTTVAFIGTMDVPYIAEYVDLLAFAIVILFVVFLSFGVRMTSNLTNVLSFTNVTALLVVVCVGAYFSNTTNWTNPQTGGFLPFGWSGVLAASASCFYTYVGFECVTSLGEEAKDPLKSIPRSIMVTMIIVSALYISLSCVLTLMVNYQDLVENSGIAEALAAHGAYWAKYAVVIGALSGMSTGLMVSITGIARLLYTMAEDGLFFQFCTVVNKKTEIPLRATYIVSCLGALFTLFLNIDAQVELIVIGVLISYIICSMTVIILRYKPFSETVKMVESFSPDGSKTNYNTDEAGQLKHHFQMFQTCLNWNSNHVVTTCAVIFTIFVIITCGFVNVCYINISHGDIWAVFILVLLVICITCSFTIILFHKQSTSRQTYQMPLAPLSPALSVVINAILIVNVQAISWVRLLIWIIIGLLLYFTYGIRHSRLANPSSKKESVTPTA